MWKQNWVPQNFSSESKTSVDSGKHLHQKFIREEEWKRSSACRIMLTVYGRKSWHIFPVCRKPWVISQHHPSTNSKKSCSYRTLQSTLSHTSTPPLKKKVLSKKSTNYKWKIICPLSHSYPQTTSLHAYLSLGNYNSYRLAQFTAYNTLSKSGQKETEWSGSRSGTTIADLAAEESKHFTTWKLALCRLFTQIRMWIIGENFIYMSLQFLCRKHKHRLL